MQTTGIFTTHVFNIPFSKFGEPIYLIPFGDIHRSSPACHEEYWKEFLGWAKKKPRCYFLGMGDYDDLGSASERLILTDKRLHNSTHQTLEVLYLKHTNKFAKDIVFMRGRLLGLIEGNHYGEFQNGATTTQKLCELMGCKYLGVSTFIRLRFLPQTKHHTRLSVDVWAHHGRGASRLMGGSLNRVEQMAEAAEADIFLMGHDHKKSIAPTVRFQLMSSPNNGVKLHARKILIGRTGSFLKGYEQGVASYIVDNAMKPCDIGVIKIEMTPQRDCRNGEDICHIDLHGSI